MNRSLQDLLDEARSGLDRISPVALPEVMAAGALVVDIRPLEQRVRDGALPGALVIDRNVLEWRLSPSSEHRIVDVEPGQRVVIVCSEGYSSSLAAATLKEVGVPNATDLVGGFLAWAELSRHGDKSVLNPAED